MIDAVDRWMERNNASVQEAATIIANELIKVFLGEPKENKYLFHATDLQECNGNDIERFFSMQGNCFYNCSCREEYKEIFDRLDNEPFSIKDFVTQEGWKYGYENRLHEWFEENYEEVVPENLREAIDERCSVARVVNGEAIGGGDYEVMYDLYGLAENKFAEYIKTQFVK